MTPETMQEPIPKAVLPAEATYSVSTAAPFTDKSLCSIICTTSPADEGEAGGAVRGHSQRRRNLTLAPHLCPCYFLPHSKF